MDGFAPLPGRPADAFDRCVSETCALLGIELPERPTGGRIAPVVWQHQARRAVVDALPDRPDDDDWFEPLVRVAVHDHDPSLNRRIIEPLLYAYGRRRLQERLLDYLAHGTDAERAGAARAWYWTQGGSTPVQRWQETALRVFVENDDLDVRRCILPGLSLRESDYPDDLHPLVAEAISIARAHPDEYIRHRVEHQVTCPS